jgi:hypothetical protein
MRSIFIATQVRMSMWSNRFNSQGSLASFCRRRQSAFR